MNGTFSATKITGFRRSRNSAGWFVACLTGAAALLPQTVPACAACYGASDSPMAAGMNWGIVTLLGMIVAVLSGIASCFFVLARRSAAMSKDSCEAAVLAQAQASWPVVAGNARAEAVEPQPDRRGLMPGSTLARQRKRCAQPLAGLSRPTAPRGRG